MAIKNIIYIVNIATSQKPGRTVPYEYGIESWRKWGEKNNVKVVTLGVPILPYEQMRPNWHKIFIFDLLKESNIEYDNILIVDADTIVNPNCPNLFSISEGKFGVVNNIGSYDWMLRSIENYKKHVFNNFNFDITKYFNSGMMLINKTHKEFFDEVKTFYFDHSDLLIGMQEKYGTGTDQPVLNFLTQIKNIDMKYLPYIYNMQELFAREALLDHMPYIDTGYIYHFNGIPNNADNSQTYRWMQKKHLRNYMEKINISGNPEFGVELSCMLPYVYYLHTQNKLGRLEITNGMKPFYYFHDDVHEVYSDRSMDNLVALKDCPNKWNHHNAMALTGKDYSELTKIEQEQVNGVLDYSQWTPPPLKKYYENKKINVPDEKYIIVSNRFNIEHGKMPTGYFDIPCLQTIFEYLGNKGYHIIYKRPENTEFAIDLNEQIGVNNDIIKKYGIKCMDEEGYIIDDKYLCKYYNNVECIDKYIDENPTLSYNEIQLQLFANADGFISMGGGNSIFSCYFDKPVISYITTSKELRKNYFNDNCYYKKLSKSEIYPILDPEDTIHSRGYNNYNEMYDVMRKIFNGK